MSIVCFILFFYLFLLLNEIQTGKITNSSFENSKNDQLIGKKEESPNDAEPVLLDSTSGHLEEQLDEAINDNEHRLIDLKDNSLDTTNEQELSVMTNYFLELELEEATKDDAYVPSSLDNSVSEKYDDENFEQLTLPTSELSDRNREMKYFSLDKVLAGDIPPGIVVQDYTVSDKMKLKRLYQSSKIEHRKELFDYIAQHIHNRYINCVANFRKWIINPRSGEPIFYRNCVPCTNAVDLNLQSLFDQQINNNKLQHYFVNTCDMQTQWISYISNMEYLNTDSKGYSSMNFTDIIRENLTPNHRYVIQGIVKSNGINPRDFLHVCNLVHDEYGHIWIIDGQIERVFDLNQPVDVIELNKRYRVDYVARASTGLFQPQSLVHYSRSLST
ncbi:unnamed protein product [Rotaria magnacalcarata]|uniref:Uncharacterized protein n=1 Tax=Rotaria magnacalcarata TaxID=392030 RepID=A0A816MCP5_9BILA|nr:unnamed protein product [Rotaria magnacalcarata]CAF1989782.1 unnamed protein product [Rotaria magnacalcarata]CAF2068418.1 unnamed protein product [Rotaria magnacalcarata]CAF2113134.1 unnamed protein product [Rotaria magnacalcarata]CAF3810225.1 unnamed protein product [Rotaria magnacalcarata]